MFLQLFEALLWLANQLRSQFISVWLLPLPLLPFYGFRPALAAQQAPESRASYQRCGRTPRRQLVMDYIFECFFNDTFEHITRNGLQDRQSRRDVLDHLSAIIKGCSEGQNVQTDEVASIAVCAALRFHRLAKQGNGGKVSELKQLRVVFALIFYVYCQSQMQMSKVA